MSTWKRSTEIMIDNCLVDVIDDLPHGSGLDSDYSSELYLNESTNTYLARYEIGYHHMNSVGFYCGWSNVVIDYTIHLDIISRVITLSNPDITIQDDCAEWEALSISDMDNRDYETDPLTDDEINDFMEWEIGCLVDYFYQTFPELIRFNYHLNESTIE